MSPILEEANLVILWRPSLPDTDVNHLAKEQVQLASHLVHASPGSLIGLMVEDAFYEGNFKLRMIFSRLENPKVFH